MKKLILFILLSFVWVSIYPVYATDFEDTISGIGVATHDFSFLDGHIDMLVPKSDFENELNDEINQDFIDTYSNYEDFVYLNDIEWISYYAFVEDAHCDSLPNQSVYEFATRNNEYLRLDEIKFIHVDSEGDTVAISDIYMVPNPLFFQDFSHLIYYNTESGGFSSGLKLRLDGIFVFLFFVTLFIASVLSTFRLIVAKTIKYDFINKGWIVPYYVLIYMFILIVGFILLNQVDFIQRLVPNIWSFIIYAFVLSLVEVGISYFLIARRKKNSKYFLFSSISYAIIFIFILLVSFIT
ncbi:MAG: hypothetical protein ACQERX_02645 [Bacillota bacterium]